MAELIRLDKLLSEMGIGSRREIKEYAKKGKISVNDKIVKNSDIKISTDTDTILFEGKPVLYKKYEYYMLNKPAGVVSATEDKKDKTVVDLITTGRRKDLFPVGRLDKDTVGLLLITNDGELAHNLLAPSKHISKTYYAKIIGEVTKNDIIKFNDGIKISEDFVCKPALLEIINSDDISEIKLTIYEGKFHQVKRMFAALGYKVIYLQRLSMGDLVLDDNLLEGDYRELTVDEIELLVNSRRD